MSVLRGKEWQAYLIKNKFLEVVREPIIGQMKLYQCTHRHEAIYKLGDYYFCFAIRRGYTNLTSLKRLV